MTITNVGEAFDYPEELQARIQGALEGLAELRAKAAPLLEEAAEILREDDVIDRAVGQELQRLGLDTEQVYAIQEARTLVSPAKALTTSLQAFERLVGVVTEPTIDWSGMAASSRLPAGDAAEAR